MAQQDDMASLLRWLIEERFKNPLDAALQEIFSNFNQLSDGFRTMAKTLVGRIDSALGKLDDISQRLSNLQMQNPSGSASVDVNQLQAAFAAFQELTMTKFEEAKQQAAANAASAQTSADLALKNQNELKAKLAEIAGLQSQSDNVQGRIDTAVAAARAAQKADDAAGAESQMAEVVRLQAEQTTIQDKLKDTLTATDKLVDDAPATDKTSGAGSDVKPIEQTTPNSPASTPVASGPAITEPNTSSTTPSVDGSAGTPTA